MTLNGVTKTETTTYVGALEIVTDGSGNGTHNRYNLSAYGKAVAIVDLESDSSTNPAINQEYLLTDHLGSVDVATDSTGTIVGGTGWSFEAFGKRRDPVSWQPPQDPAQVVKDRWKVTHRGFTGHEMLDNVGLVHMNGRVYDPALGRFLSMDPVFQFPTNTQSLNPYSYVLNNPLSLTDPTGYTPSCSPDSHHSCGADTMTGSRIAGVKTGIKGSDVGFLKTSRLLASVGIKLDASTRVVGGQFENGAKFGQDAAEAQTKPASTSSTNSPGQTAKQSGETEATGTSVTATGADDQTEAQKPFFFGNLSLTDDQQQTLLTMASNPYDPNNPTEAFQLIRSDSSLSDRSTEGCDNSGCPAFRFAIELHWHVNVQNVPNGMTQAEANLTREFPGPGDAALIGYHTVNVGVTPMGAVWALPRINGVITLQYLKHSSNPMLDKFIKAHWTPGMSETSIDDLVKRNFP